MLAIRIVCPGRVEAGTSAEPEPGPEDVLVEVKMVGLCGSDLNTYRGRNKLVSYPRIPGHEVSGVVGGLGRQVPRGLALGDRVTISPYLNCGQCATCLQGRTNCCPSLRVLGVHTDGALVERLAVHHSRVFRSDTLTLEELALVEPWCIGHHAAKRGRVVAGDRVLVIGSGTIGLAVIAAAARSGALVMACDVDATKLEHARRFGALYTIDSSREDVLRRVDELTSGEGANVTIEAVGLPQTYQLAVDAVCHAGRVVYVGHSKDAVTYDPEHFVRKELDILGSRNARNGDFREVLEMVERRELPYTTLISATYPFREAGRALADWDAAPSRFVKILVAR